MELKHSEKVFGADNQQERLKIESWITGFTDGEGCFSVSFIRNKTTKWLANFSGVCNNSRRKSLSH